MNIFSLVKVALYYLLNVVNLILVVRCIVSWLPIGYNRFTEILYSLTEPFLAPIRRLLEKTMGGSTMYIDFSPVVAFLLISLIQRLIFMI